MQDAGCKRQDAQPAIHLSIDRSIDPPSTDARRKRNSRRSSRRSRRSRTPALDPTRTTTTRPHATLPGAQHRTIFNQDGRPQPNPVSFDTTLPQEPWASVACARTTLQSPVLHSSSIISRPSQRLATFCVDSTSAARRTSYATPPRTALFLASAATPSSTDEVRERSVQEVARPRSHARPVQRARPGSARAPPHSGPPRRRPRFRLRRRRSHARAAARGA